jgi:TetR/AcrR family transcriptional regulator, tetracycline repressor protein
MALTQDDVVQAAVRLLDDVGLEGLTLRRLAAELGVCAPTLYWHVKDKRTLLDLVAEAIVAKHRTAVRPAPGQPWWEWLNESAWAHYHALVSHRDGALVLAGNRPTEASLPAVEQVLGSLIDVGFPPAEALVSLLTIGNFVMGSAVEYQAEIARATATDRDAALAIRVREAEDLPNLHAAASTHQPGADPDAVFRHGLDLILTGLRARHHELTSVPAGHS